MTPAMTLRPLFVTHLYEGSLAADKGFEAFNAELEDACRAIAAEDRAGRAWAKEKGYSGYTSYASLDDLPQRDSLFADLKKKLDKHAAAFAKDLNLRAGRRQAGDGQPVDQHPQARRRPQRPHPSPQRAVGHGLCRHPARRLGPEAGGSAPAADDGRAHPPGRRAGGPLQTFVYVQPQPGTVLMWESWLRHEVPANAARQERISISFNYAWR
jgi:hypothetical protein